jgi:CRISPR/Cas system-associated protein Cas5 (RAMP superfamily)
MQVIGWISILVGLLYAGKVSGILLIIIGIAVVYVMRKTKRNETEMNRSVFQAQIKKTKGLKKLLGMTKQERKRDVPAASLLTRPPIKPKEGKKQKPDWFIYTK